MLDYLKDHRVNGVKEHYFRIKRFINNAKRAKKSETKFRNMIAAVYPARAIAELIFESAEKGLVQKTRDEIKSWLEKEVPFFSLVEKIRIHDFHRFGCLPPNPKVISSFIGGPVKLKASSGYAHVNVSLKEEVMTTSGGSAVQKHRPLYNHDGHFFDESSGKYINLGKIIEDYAKTLPSIISKFEKMMK